MLTKRFKIVLNSILHKVVIKGKIRKMDDEWMPMDVRFRVRNTHKDDADVPVFDCSAEPGVMENITQVVFYNNSEGIAKTWVYGFLRTDEEGNTIALELRYAWEGDEGAPGSFVAIEDTALEGEKTVIRADVPDWPDADDDDSDSDSDDDDE